jgi:hypothetical protein
MIIIQSYLWLTWRLETWNEQKYSTGQDTILLRDTLLSPDTSPMQTARKNLAALKSYRADTKLLTAALPPDFQDGRLKARK